MKRRRRRKRPQRAAFRHGGGRRTGRSETHRYRNPSRVVRLIVHVMMGEPMKSFLVIAFLLVLLATAACNSPKQVSGGAKAADLTGKWRLVRVAGKAPAELAIPIKSQEVTVAADGTWKSRVKFTLPGFRVPDAFDANGKL